MLFKLLKIKIIKIKFIRKNCIYFVTIENLPLVTEETMTAIVHKMQLFCLSRQPAGMAEWIAHLLVNPAAWDQISLLPKVSVHCCLPFTACMRNVWKVGLLYSCLYSVHPYWWKKTGVGPDMTLRLTTCKQVSVQVREAPWFWKPWGGSHEAQNRGNQWPHKMDLGPTKI